MKSEPSIIVVGGSVAGGATVAQLRADGHTGQIHVIDQDPDAPYDRPPLSKEFFSTDDRKPHAPWWDGRCELIRGQATALNPEAHTVSVRTADGEMSEFDADHIVLATGSVPVRLPDQPDDVAELRTAADARRIRQRVTPGLRTLILGAGTVGTELASTLVTAGVDVTLVDLASRPLDRFFAGHLGTESEQWIRDAGVHLLLGTRVTAIKRKAGEWAVSTDDGDVPADLVVCAVGTRPSTDWLTDAGLGVGNGIHCDHDGRVLTATDETISGVWAIGDVAAWAEHGGRRRREDWTSAQRQGRHVARLIGGLQPAQHFQDELDYFWTHQFGRRVQVLGTPTGDAAIVQQVDDPERRAAFYALTRDGTPRAWISVNRPREFTLALRQSMAGV